MFSVNILLAALMPHPPLMIPAIGQGEEKRIQETLDHAEAIGRKVAEACPQTIVIISPHGPVFSDAITVRNAVQLTGDLKAFGCSEVTLSKNTDLMFVGKLLENASKKGIPSTAFDYHLAERFGMDESLDHGVLVPLHFIEKYYSNYELVAINYGLLSDQSLYRFGKQIQMTAEQLDRKIVVIASGDLSHHLKDTGHYTYNSSGPEFDEKIMTHLKNQDVLSALTLDKKMTHSAGECGKRSIDIMLGSLEGYKANQVSATYQGPFGVGYGMVCYSQFEKDTDRQFEQKLQELMIDIYNKRKASESPYVKLAREVVETFVRTGEILDLPEKYKTPEFIDLSAGAFVSIKNSGGLRGCIGTISATCNTLAEEIISNAIKACSEDSRFDPIEVTELEDLLISVDVLSTPEHIPDSSELDPKKYGVIVKCGWRQGLLLPDLEGVDTIEEQLRIAKNKGGIESHEHVELYRFIVERYE